MSRKIKLKKTDKKCKKCKIVKSDEDIKYECLICSKKSEQKGHHITHLNSQSHMDKRRIKELELKNKTNEELYKEYFTDDIEKILIRLEMSYFINYEFKKYKKSNKLIYKLSVEELNSIKDEEEFKNKFKLFLNELHNYLRGAAVTGDDAFDDILYMLMYCFLQDKNFDEGKYNFNNTDINTFTNKKKLNQYIQYLKIDKLLEDTLCIRPSKDSGLCAIVKIGTVLKNHPTTKNLIVQEDFIKCSNRNIILKCLEKSMKFIKENYNDIIKYQDIVGIAYEYFINKHGGNGGTSKEMGQYFTERPLMNMTFQLIEEEDLKALDINNNSTIGDEFCATFGYPISLRQYLTKFNIEIKDNNMYGVEFHERLSRMAVLNAMFSMESYNNVIRGDSFITNVSPHIDISVHNVPFGQSMKFDNIETTYKNFKTENPNLEYPDLKDIIHSEANVDAILASQLALYKTKKMGLLIIKDGKETTSDSHKDYRKFLCDSCCIKKILKIPSGAFSSTGTKTVCIYFIKKEGLKTEEIQFLELNDTGNEIKEICKVSLMDLKSKNYSWDPEIYILDETFDKIKEKSNCEFIELREAFSLIKGEKSNSKTGLEEGLYPLYYCSILKNLYLNTFKYDGEGIIINKTNGSGKSMVYYHNGKYNVGNTTIHFKSSKPNKLLTKYLFYYLRNNIPILEKKYKGSNQKSLDNNDLQELEIPTPTIEIQNQTLEILNDLVKQKKSLEELKTGIERRMKYYMEKEIKKNETKIVKLGSITTHKRGERKTKKNHIENGLYYVYGGGDKNKNFKTNDFNRKSHICKISRYGASPHNFIMLLNEKLWLHDNAFSIESNNINILINSYLWYYLLLLIKNNFQYQRLYNGCPTALSMYNFNELNIYILNISKQKEIVEYLDNLDNKKNNLETEINDIDTLMKEVLEQSYQ